MTIDKDLLEHLAADTGLAPEQIEPGVHLGGDDERATHLHQDTGVPAAELEEHTEDTSVIGVTPGA